jgi:hypothetical protein
MAYLTVMYGRLPDANLLSAAYAGAAEPEPRRRHLAVVPAVAPPDPTDERAAAA